MVERQAAIERGLAEQQHAARVVGAGGSFAQRSDSVATGADFCASDEPDSFDSALTRLAFENLLHPFQPFIFGQKSLPPKLAVLHDIPL